MLSVTRRGDVQDVRELSAQEDRALRRAFGRLPEPDARTAGAAVLRRYQRLGAGCWVLCDCLGDVSRPPALVPVSETHIRRHYDPPWPAHDPDCDFHRDAAQQRAITRSYVRLPEGRTLSLLGRLQEDSRERDPCVTRRSYGRQRGALATLLMQLIETAELNRVPARGDVAPLGEQYKALRAAARAIDIDEGVKLSSFFCTYLPGLPELIARLERTPAGAFPKSGRPHGVLIAVVSDAAAGFLQPLSGDPIPVRGEIGIFGEREGHSRNSVSERSTRSPYLAICVVGRPDASSPVETLKAYLHPCLSTGHLMPVDSNLERQTFHLLGRLRSWLSEKKHIGLAIKKPVFDISAESGSTGIDPDVDEVREPCIPDFLLFATQVGRGGRSSIVVECMGYADAQYRERKQRTHALMSLVTGGSPVVEHDFHLPVDQTQADRDRLFWLGCRWKITGPSE